MTDFENAYVGMGTSPHLDFDFKAIAGDKKTWSPTWGFVTKNWMSDLVMFKIGVIRWLLLRRSRLRRRPRRQGE